jgi:hypothetical protein
MVDIHNEEMVIKHSELLVKLSEQTAAACRKIEQLEKFLTEHIKARDKQITFLTEETTDIYKRLLALEIATSSKSGGKKWEDHIITVLIGAAVLIGMYVITHGVK